MHRPKFILIVVVIINSSSRNNIAYMSWDLWPVPNTRLVELVPLSFQSLASLLSCFWMINNFREFGHLAFLKIRS
jgi:hypothetical protein